MASSQSKFYGALVGILIVGAAAIGYTIVRDRQQQTSLESTTPLQDLPTELVSEDVGVRLGAMDAPVVIEEYADYQCPYCGMVATLTVPQIIETYVETGKARFVFFDFPLNPGASQLGAEAARCAGDQGAFWAMHKVLMGRMREWGSRRNPRSAFREYAEALGIDGKALVECVDTRKHREVVLAGQTRGRQLGLTGTPTFIINGRRVGSTMGFDQMAALIEEELAKQ